MNIKEAERRKDCTQFSKAGSEEAEKSITLIRRGINIINQDYNRAFESVHCRHTL